MIEFVETPIDELSLNAAHYLNKAVNRTPANEKSLWEVISSGGIAYTIKSDDKTIGATYIELTPTILNIVLLAGENIKDWRDEAYHFYIDLIKSRGINHICVFGRSGWGKLFPELTTVGTIFTLTQGGGYVAKPRKN